MSVPNCSTFKAAAIQMVSSKNLADNLVQAESLIKKAALAGAQLVVLPENFAFMGISAKELYLTVHEQPELLGKIIEFLGDQSSLHKMWLVGGTIPSLKSTAGIFDANGRPYSSVLTFNASGDCISQYDKIHLFDSGVDDGIGQYRESDSYAHGSQIGIVETPFGKMGLAVCYDLRFPEYFRVLQSMGADFFVLPSAFTYQTGLAHWEVLIRARAIENQCAVIASNQGGRHDEKRHTYGHSCIVNAWGDVIAESINEGQSIAFASIDLSAQKVLRQKMPVMQHRTINCGSADK